MPLYWHNSLTESEKIFYAGSQYPGKTSKTSKMQEKQKITLYIPPGLHRQLKVRSAIDSESMSAIVEKAINFYLHHPDIVEETTENVQGKTHQVHICPECDNALVLREGEMVSLRNQPSVIEEEEEFPLEIAGQVNTEAKSNQEKLVHC